MARTPTQASHHVGIGRDTRSSAGYLFLALARGLHKEGIRIFDFGVCPTPAVSIAVNSLGLNMGIVITASHNPASDNGIKLFQTGGCKLSPDQELAIEALIDTLPSQEEDYALTPPVRYYEARRHYLEFYKGLLPENALMGLRIVLDCANGSTFRTSGEMLGRLGAQVITRGCDPDGDNINADVGSEHPEVISQAVRASKADLGIAHDGDGDRVILCDASGAILDGDAVLAILGANWAKRQVLTGHTVVATIMSNLGLDKCLREHGVTLKRTGVGDRQVYFAMRDGGYILGGEASGHFIDMTHLPTGDGLLAAMLVLRELILNDRPLADLASIYQPFPQLKENLPVKFKMPLASNDDLRIQLESLQNRLGEKGRILLRYSGTESKIRLLSEAEDPDLARQILTELKTIVHAHLPIGHPSTL